jgi:hypothetical protein
MELSSSQNSDHKIEKSKANITSAEETIKYSWLAGDPEEDIWDFVEYIEGQYASRLRLTWRPTFKVQSVTTRMRWNKWVGIAKSLCINLFESKSVINKTGSNKVKAQYIKYVAQFFCFERRRFDLSEIDLTDILALEQHLKQRALTTSTVGEYLRAIRDLWLLNSDNWSGLSFDPYPSSVKRNNTVKQLGVKNGHTKTLKPITGLFLLDSAIKLIANSDKTLSNYSLYNEIKISYAEPSSAYFRRTKQKASALIEEVRLLYAAAILITLTLTAMRKHELTHILHQDALDMTEGNVSVLTGRVHKTARVLSGKETQRQSVVELRDAISVIIRLTQDVRDKTNNKSLLLRLSTHNSVGEAHTESIPLGLTSLYTLLDLFSKNMGFTDGTLRPHMFRRFFAMMWAWRFEVGNLHYLSKMLYHNGYEFTTAYTEDQDVWTFMSDEMKSLTHAIFEDILTGEKQIVSGFSRTIERYKRIIQVNVSIVNSQHISEFVEVLLQRNDYIIMPAADGFCFMTPSRASTAKCSTNGVLPDYSNRNEIFCGICSNFGTTKDKIDIWVERKHAHQKTLNTTNSKALKSAAIKGILNAERVINSINIKEVR